MKTKSFGHFAVWIFGSRLTKDEVEDLIFDLEKLITIEEKRHVCKKG
jgi:hypothetical protein